MSGTAHERALHLDLAGLREEYVHQDPPMARGTAVRWLLAGAVAVTAAAVLAVVTEHLGLLVGALLHGVAAVVVVSVTDRPRWRPRTVLRPEELDVRDRGLFRDRFAWWWVVEVQCHPARRPPGRVVLQDGRRLRLRGMPAADVERLARALERARAATHGSGS
ncbi:hypothetical protein [uncultured Pseudokineococcus sp.]|uniref:hypothetical protein n=1 Tax=uncultured Pseudokineococcus sp. TaxID=1642928 RepID=UPI0026078BD2|nr:hypothetical protein [uncultured Pseudokineococcus sp.]